MCIKSETSKAEFDNYVKTVKLFPMQTMFVACAHLKGDCHRCRLSNEYNIGKPDGCFFADVKNGVYKEV